MGTGARVITTSNFTKDAGFNEGKDLSAILNYSEDVSGIKMSDPNSHNQVTLRVSLMIIYVGDSRIVYHYNGGKDD